MPRRGEGRGYLSFRAVNRRNQPGYDAGLQRHHLLPRQLLGQSSLESMFTALGGVHRHFEDFRSNGLLLPCREHAALRMGLPLHRGPHSRYTELVLERVGQIEADWVHWNMKDPISAAIRARMRLDLLQRALRRYLLDSSRRIRLNKLDMVPGNNHFAELDALADAMWAPTCVPDLPHDADREASLFLPFDPTVQAMPVREQRACNAA